MKRNGLGAVGGMMCGIFGMTLGGVIFIGGMLVGGIIVSDFHKDSPNERKYSFTNHQGDTND